MDLSLVSIIIIFFYHIVTDAEFMLEWEKRQLALLIHLERVRVRVISPLCTEAGARVKQTRELYLLSPDCLGFLRLVWCRIALSILKGLAWRWAPPERGGRGTRWQR